jgi:uncharacterized protein (DUF1015 family)
LAVIKPFRGLRPQSHFAAEVASPPYDVLSSDEARRMVKDNPNSFLRVNKSEVDFPEGESNYSNVVYEKGRRNLERLINDNIMIREDKNSFYIYRLTMNDHTQTGLVALASVEEYDKGIIKKHENTQPKKVEDRANHMIALEAQVGPVFSTFRQNEQLKELFKKLTSKTPEIDFVADDKIRHELWVVSEESNCYAFIDGFAELNELYIADGHHRSEAASEVCRRLKESNDNHTGNENYNYFLSVLFPDDELYVMSYNRVVSEMNSLSIDEFIQKCTYAFEIDEVSSPVVPDENHTIGVYCENRWFKFKIKNDSFDETNPVESIDSAILTKNLLAPILDITDLGTDKRISFIGGIRGVEELSRLVDSNEYKVAFSMYPVSVEQLLAVADADDIMPTKSTWFEPKLRSGMVVSLLND